MIKLMLVSNVFRGRNFYVILIFLTFVLYF